MALESLEAKKDIIVTKPDKGRGVVVLDKNTYVSKINELISDRTKFELISAPVHRYTRKIEDKLNNFLHKIKDSIDVPLKHSKIIYFYFLLPVQALVYYTVYLKFTNMILAPNSNSAQFLQPIIILVLNLLNLFLPSSCHLLITNTP